MNQIEENEKFLIKYHKLALSNNQTIKNSDVFKTQMAMERKRERERKNDDKGVTYSEDHKVVITRKNSPGKKIAIEERKNE